MSEPAPLVLALARILGGEEAARVVADHLRAHPGYDRVQRAAAARRLFATALLRARLEHLAGAPPVPYHAATPSRVGDLDEGAPGDGRPDGGPLDDAAAIAPPAASARAAWHLAAYLRAEEGAADAEIAALTGLPLAARSLLVARLAARPEWPTEPAARLAAERSLPPWLARLWVDELGPAAADALLQVLNRPGPVTVRVNLHRAASAEALAAELAAEGVVSSPARFSPWGLHLWGPASINGSVAWRRGAFEVQDEGSQLVALAASPRPGERVVDYCAGAGGKTLALAGLLRPEAALWVADVDAHRLRELRGRLRRACPGAHAEVVALPPRRPGVSLEARLAAGAAAVAPGFASLGAGADLVLVDAPCSSLGTLRRGPDRRWRVDPTDLARFPPLQGQLLREAAALVVPGGRLVYATCTLRRAENEAVAEDFSAEAAPLGFAPLPVAALLGDPLARRLGADEHLVLRPDLHGTDGFFVAAWRRRA